MDKAKSGGWKNYRRNVAVNQGQMRRSWKVI